jgi:hypothetical protein
LAVYFDTNHIYLYAFTSRSHLRFSASQYNTPSISPLSSGSGDAQHYERVLTYSGGRRQHEFSASDVEPYLTASAGNLSHENSLQACMDNFTLQLASRCATCDSYLMRRTTFIKTPPLLAFDISNGSTLTLDLVVWILCDNSCIRYVLRGVIYFSNEHFTEHVVTSTSMIWYHDGIFTGPSLVYESQDLTST